MLYRSINFYTGANETKSCQDEKENVENTIPAEPLEQGLQLISNATLLKSNHPANLRTNQ